MEELQDILAGLNQRISAYKIKLQELQKKRDRLDDEIQTIKKYLELAETLYKVEQEKARVAAKQSSPSEGDRDKNKVAIDVPDQSQAILFGRTKYLGMSVPQAALLLLKDAGTPMHAKEVYQRLVEGGVRIRGKTPVTAVAISLRRDKRFRKVAPNTFELVEETLMTPGGGA